MESSGAENLNRSTQRTRRVKGHSHFPFAFFACFCSLLFLFSTLTAVADNRFPKPQFESGYTMPSPSAPVARSLGLEILDVAVLTGALSLAAWLVLRKRSRRGVVLLTIFSLIYFGFFRKGCVCPVGSIQNVALWLFDSHAALSLSVTVFFLLPLIFALLFGRVFCAAVCPLGTIQDLVILSPTKVHPVLAQILGFIPYLYLGLGILFAATGSAYVICRLDPFVSLFRLSGELPMIIAGIVFLLIGTVIARPYCRFMCPYGVLLNWMSRLSKYHATITPTECVKCRLCEPACPFDAILAPQTHTNTESRYIGVRRLALMIVLLPVLIVGGVWSASLLAPTLARLHPTVKLLNALQLSPQQVTTAESRAITAFNGSGASLENLEQQAATIQTKFRYGSWALGGFLGTILGCWLIAASIKRRQEFYEPDRGTCLSCARCYLSCPEEHLRISGNQNAAK
jgi:NosR/NirI family nitrous oxide reductase transcriptional regulator